MSDFVVAVDAEVAALVASVSVAVKTVFCQSIAAVKSVTLVPIKTT
jgi:hypothetical protein